VLQPGVVPDLTRARGDGCLHAGARCRRPAQAVTTSGRLCFELLSAAYALSPAFGEAEISKIGVDSAPAFPTPARIERQGNLIRAMAFTPRFLPGPPRLARWLAT